MPRRDNLLCWGLFDVEFVRINTMRICRAGMFKSCAIASDTEEMRNQGCLQLAKALREVVTAEQDLQAKNAAYISGVVGKAVVSEHIDASGQLFYILLQAAAVP